MGNIEQHTAAQGTNELLNNAEDAMDPSHLQSAADQNRQL
jgi:hypothetical protein